MDPKQIGDMLKELRKDHRKTIEEFSNDLGISQSAVGMYESGKRIPRDEIKIKIAQYYNVPIERIFYPQLQHETCEFPDPLTFN